jgi:hypothetical protein
MSLCWVSHFYCHAECRIFIGMPNVMLSVLFIAMLSATYHNSYTECQYAECHIFIVMLYVAFYRHAEYSIFIVILNVMLCVTFLLQC